MFLRCANSIYTARIMGEAGDSTSVQIADLLLTTVIVDFALDRLTANFVVSGISEEARFAGARCDVIIRLAFGVTATEY